MKQGLGPSLGYEELLEDLKDRIREAQVRAAMAVSRELVLLSRTVGREMNNRFGQQEWGIRIIDRLAGDLQD
ncbi:DUF1016 family protein [Acidipila sp. EB88]|uniref:DUF1016 family protein n=1 Tax=Acidipila sp. EB88 TaxID=2305226 RepID=UPI000F5E4B71|nr:DUF1016 family protein [Acidipila sp. EB88]RRA49615.1 DUF1016 family protein [Acidipila sp. EB88]